MGTMTYNIKLIMSHESRAFWESYLSEAANAYDECSSYIKENNLPLNIQVIHCHVYDWMRKHYTHLSSQAIIKIYKDVIGAYRTMKKVKHVKDSSPRKCGMNIRIDKRLYSNLTKDGVCLTGICA